MNPQIIGSFFGGIMIDLKRANEVFDNYVKNYDMSNEKINLNNHINTNRVYPVKSQMLNDS